MSHNVEQAHTDLTGHVALVTGGGRGIGRACAQALAAAGAAVAVVARSVDQITETAASMSARGQRALALPVDVSDLGAVEQMVREVEDRLGPVDLLLNNAGILRPLGPVAEVDPGEWWRCIEINLRGPLLCTRALLPGMLTRRRGRIINVASMSGLRAYAYGSAYCVSKTALLRFTEQVAVEVADYGICAFAIDPGPIRTALTTYLMESPAGQKWVSLYRERFDSLEVPVDRAVHLMLFLASGQADCLTGRLLSVFDDVAQLVEHGEEIARGDLYMLRLCTPSPHEKPSSSTGVEATG